jgi:hypothetical protein
MSRSGYSEDCDDEWTLIRWRGAVTSSFRGKRGQAFLKELLAALDAMPKKELIAEALEAQSSYCTLGVIGKERGLDLEAIDPEDRETVAHTFGIAHAMACEIMWANDEYYYSEKPEARWLRMRNWIANHIIKDEPDGQ